jgi:CheY-like chemotaxis protein
MNATLLHQIDPSMQSLFGDALEKKSHRIVLASDGFNLAPARDFESLCTILDAMLPGIDGFSVARSLRTSRISTPIIMLTARDATGMAPLAYIVWLGSGRRLEPLSMPLSLSPSQYTSPFFATDLDDDYQIQLSFLPVTSTGQQPCQPERAREALTRSHNDNRFVKFPHRGLHRSSKDERTVTTACLQPDPENGLQRPSRL